jgi:hypothetical protein
MPSVKSYRNINKEIHPGILKQYYSCTQKLDITPQKLTLYALAYN